MGIVAGMRKIKSPSDRGMFYLLQVAVISAKHDAASASIAG